MSQVKKFPIFLILLLPLAIQAQTAVIPSGAGTQNNPYLIDSLPNLVWLSTTSNAWASTFLQTKNIDATDSKNWNSGAGFTPIGNITTAFTGTYHGAGHVIQGVYINQPSSNWIGLFGLVQPNATIDSLGLENVNVTGSTIVGGLAGGNGGTINACYSTGTVAGVARMGGLVGILNNGKITASHSTASVTGSSNKVGGLLGELGTGKVFASYATGTVKGINTVGGLVGICLTDQFARKVNTSFASGSVIASSDTAGGLFGSIGEYCYVDSSYSTGSVTGARYVGGFVGHNDGYITTSYTLSAIPDPYNSSALALSAFVGKNNFFGSIVTSYWSWEIGGFLSQGFGINSGNFNISGRYLNEMKQQAKMSNLGNFSTTWMIYEGQSNPLLRSILTPVTVSAKDTTKVYNGAAFSGGNGLRYSKSVVDSLVLGTPTYSGTGQGAIDTGTYGIAVTGGLYSSQLGYLFSYSATPGILKINPKPITITGATATNKTYDGATAATVTSASLTGKVAGDDVTLTLGNATFATKDTGTAKPVTVTGSVLTGTKAGNYTLIEVSGLSANITAAPLTITGATAVNKTYDGTTSAMVTGATLDGYVSGDDVTLALGKATFATKDTGTAKPVTVTGSIIEGTSAGNYTLAEVIGLNAKISPKTIHVKAIADTISVGDIEPDLTYIADSLFTGDAFTGILGRASGTDIGVYPIQISTLSAGDNYIIIFTTADFVIQGNPVFLDPVVPHVAFTGCAHARIFNPQGKLVWSGSLDVNNDRVAMPNLGMGRWVVKFTNRK